MTDSIEIIKPQRVGLWTAAAFIVALLALVASMVGIMKYRTLAMVSQSQVLMLNKKIEDLRGSVAAPVAPPSAVQQNAKK